MKTTTKNGGGPIPGAGNEGKRETAKTSFTSANTRAFLYIIAIVLMLICVPSVSGIGIGGVAREPIYGVPISGATISVKNSTTSESYTETTNAAGWYLCDNGHSCSLVNTRLYAVQGSATGYNTSPVYSVVVSGS